MISLHIERINVVDDGNELHDMSTGKTVKFDKWERHTLYMQTFPDGTEPDINKVIRVANGGES